MKIKALKTLVGSYGRLNKGDEVNLERWLANDLIALGYAAEVSEDAVTDEPEAPKRGRPRKKDASG